MNCKHVIFSLFLCLSFQGLQAQVIDLLEQYNGRYQFTMLGNTLADNENNSVCPNPTFQNTTSANLTLAPGQDIIAAYLYWSGSGVTDNSVNLDGVPLIADESFQTNSGNSTFYSSRKEVTAEVQLKGSGNYTVNGINFNSTTHSCFTRYAGWIMIVVYEDPTFTLNSVYVYDGLQVLSGSSGPLNINLTNLFVVTPLGAELGFLAFEGDSGATGESASINGNVLGTTLNPANNPFNGTNTYTGSTAFPNMDMDFYDVEPFVNAGDVTANIQFQSPQDLVVFSAMAMTLNNELPDPTIVLDNVEQNDCDVRSFDVDFTVFNDPANQIMEAGVPIVFYADAVPGVILGQTQTTADMPIGGSESFTLTLTIPASVPQEFDLIGVVNDDGTGTRVIMELDPDNNEDMQAYRLGLTPVANNDMLNECDLGAGLADFDLDAISGAVSDDDPNMTVTFHDTQADANAGVNDLPSPLSSLTRTIFARVDDLATGCFNTSQVQLSVDETPIANPIDDFPICDDNNDGSWEFDLNTRTPMILGGQSASQFTVTYHETSADAINDVNPIPTSYTNTSSPQNLFARIENVDNDECFQTTSFQIRVNDTPSANDVTIPLVICSVNPNGDFDLNSIIPDVTGGVSGVVTTFHASQADADAGIAALPSPFNSPSVRIFSRVEVASSGCYETAFVDLEVLAQPERRDQNTALCSSTGTASFDLNQFDIDIINGAPNVAVSYHATIADANAGINPLSSPHSTNTTTVFARSEANYLLMTCFNVSHVRLLVNANPTAVRSTINQCSDMINAEFDLDSSINSITGGAGNRTVTFHTTMADAASGINPLTSPFTSPSATIFANVVNNATSCNSQIEVDLVVLAKPVFTEPINIRQCESNEIATFNLAREKARLQLENPGLAFDFYPTIVDAVRETNGLPGSLVAVNSTIYTRIFFPASDCFITRAVRLIIEETPLVENTAIICIGDSYTLPSGTVVNDPGIYPETIQNRIDGCDVDYVTTVVLGQILFPDAFTPNGNGENDYFLPLPNQACAPFVDNYQMTIWNRWGEKVFESSSFTEGWDGRHNGQDATPDLFIWIVNYTFQGQDVEQKGSISLLR